MRKFLLPLAALAALNCSPAFPQAAPNQVRQPPPQRASAALDTRGRADLRRDIDRISRDIYRPAGRGPRR
jgi:hypothetical protein